MSEVMQIQGTGRLKDEWHERFWVRLGLAVLGGSAAVVLIAGIAAGEPRLALALVGGMFYLLAKLALAAVAVSAPAAVAYRKEHKYRHQIAILTAFLAWCFLSFGLVVWAIIGWVGVLVWASMDQQ